MASKGDRFWHIPADLKTKIEEVNTELGIFVEQRKDEWSGKSERWRESEKGEAIEEFLNTWEEVQVAIDDARDSMFEPNI